MTQLEQLKLKKAIVEGRLRILERELGHLEEAIRQVMGSLKEQEMVGIRINGESVRKFRAGRRGVKR